MPKTADQIVESLLSEDDGHLVVQKARTAHGQAVQVAANLDAIASTLSNLHGEVLNDILQNGQTFLKDLDKIAQSLGNMSIQTGEMAQQAAQSGQGAEESPEPTQQQ